MKIDLKFLVTVAFVPLLLAVLFALVFTSLKVVAFDTSFFIELLCVTGISVICKMWFYPVGEDKALKQKDLDTLKSDYFKYVDAHIKSSKSLDDFLVILNARNKEDYVRNKIGKRTPITLRKHAFWFLLFHWKYRKLTEEEIGKIRYEYLLHKYWDKADKLPPIYSQDIMELNPSIVLADSKNYRKKHKIQYQTITTVGSVGLLTALSLVGWESIMANWENVFRYLTYVFTIFSTSATTYFTAFRTADMDERSHVQRCRDIVRKYNSYILEGGNNVNNNNTISVALEQRERSTISDSFKQLESMVHGTNTTDPTTSTDTGGL